MKKALALTAGILLTAANLYAGNGDLIVDGNLGVGTGTPGAKLDVNGEMKTINGGSAYYGIGSVHPDSGDADSDRPNLGTAIPVQRINYHTGLSFSAHSYYGGIRFYNQGYSGSESNPYKLSGAPVMTISNGNVGIGTTNPGYKLQLSVDSAAKPGTSTWTIASDEKLKTDIRPFKDGLSTILGINPVMYRYNGKGGIPEAETGKDNIGVVAQEIQKVAPYTVGKFKAKFNKEDTEDTELLDFNSHALVFVLINAVKEQQKQIADQQKRIDDLEKKVGQVK